MEKIKQLFTKPREKVIEDLIKSVVKDITSNFEYKFSYEEQFYILDTVKERFLDIHTEKRNKLITEARKIQDSIVAPKAIEEGDDKS